MSAWCSTCVHDLADDCPILPVALMGHTPEVWVEKNPDGLADRYECTEYKPRQEKHA